MDEYILAIESSCDETSVSIVKNGVEEINTTTLTQIPIHQKYGGVVPEIASRNHVKHITEIIEECLNKSKLTLSDISSLAVTYGPGLIGSLLVGIEAAKTLAYIYNKPLIPVHHLAGHIYANNIEKELEFPLIALIVSGGHTELIRMNSHYEFEKLGQTLDDAVGESYDKVARVLDLEYPGGPKIDQLAKTGKDKYKLPLPLDDETFNFSFSGIKSAVINLNHNYNQKGINIIKEDLARSFQNRVVEILTKKTVRALKKYNINNLILAGGVSANSQLREEFIELSKKQNFNVSFPQLKYCTDNATMIASAAYYAKKNGSIADLSLEAVSSEEIN